MAVIARKKPTVETPPTPAPPSQRPRGQLPTKAPSPSIGTTAVSGGRVTVTILGHPETQGSKIATKFGGIREDNKDLKPWREAIKKVCTHPGLGLPKEFTAIDSAVEITIRCYFDPPSSAKPGDYPSTQFTGDVDKLARAINDGMQEGGVIKNDARIIDLHVFKRYIWNGGNERAEVTVRPLSYG